MYDQLQNEEQGFMFWFVVLHFIESNKSFSFVYQNKKVQHSKI